MVRSTADAEAVSDGLVVGDWPLSMELKCKK
jgi:hypothetical protein